MNRATLLNIVAARTSEPLGIVEQIVDATFAEIMATVERDSVAQVEGFGSFKAHQRPPHEHCDEAGNTHLAPAYREITFRPAAEWRKRVSAPAVQQAEAAD